MTDSIEQREREQFEEFVKRELGDVPVMDNGRYVSMKINNYWRTWQEARRAALSAPQAGVPLIARSRDEWHEDDGDVAWWAWNGREWAGEPAWIGTPLASDWPGYHTHWTPHPAMPPAPGAPAQVPAPGAIAHGATETERGNLLSWAVDRWIAEVKNRPLVNVHRRALDDTWRQVMRKLGGDPYALVGPAHDELLHANPIKAEPSDYERGFDEGLRAARSNSPAEPSKAAPVLPEERRANGIGGE